MYVYAALDLVITTHVLIVWYMYVPWPEKFKSHTLKPLEINEYIFHVKFSLGGYRKRKIS